MKTEKRKSFLSYYRPYLGLFLSDMFFACLGAAVTLVIPLIIRHITGTVIYYEHRQTERYCILLRMKALCHTKFMKMEALQR